eukprot:TRINITY_DN2511_c0_g1_i2.p1 TRINITY_DN2511_c0_g1~~TRINITY_DN2511_c0_g1_i2.p1  ORF type:complete len:798 (-),score=148.92 TRINITY_DN2511_c0_g1_i2:422-2815(-)
MNITVREAPTTVPKVATVYAEISPDPQSRKQSMSTNMQPSTQAAAAIATQPTAQPVDGRSATQSASLPQPEFVSVPIKQQKDGAPDHSESKSIPNSASHLSKSNMSGTRMDMSFVETTAMHWFTGKFTQNAQLEHDFWKQYYHRYARNIRIWLLVLPAVCIAYFGLFYAAYIEKINHVEPYGLISAVCTIITLCISITVFFTKVDNRKIQYALDASLLSTFIGFIMVEALYNEHNQDKYLAECRVHPENCIVSTKPIIERLEGQDSYALVIYAVVILSGLLNPVFRSSFVHVVSVLFCVSTCFMIATIATVNYSTDLRATSFILLIFFSSAFFSYAARESERMLRRNFLFEKDLARKNTHLKERLDRLISAKKKAVDLDSPIEKAMDILRKWRDHTELNELVGSDVDTLIGILSNPDLFSPDFKKQIKQNELEVDADIQNWIMYEFVKSNNTRAQTQRSVSFGSLVDNMRHAPNPLHSLALPGNHDKAEQIVSACEWNAEIFALNELTGGHPLIFATLQILKKHNLITLFRIPETKLINFLREVESGYLENPFHNRIHAADVTLNMNYLIHRPKVIDCLSDLDKLACILAACSHDFRHPGYNNAFHITLERPEAITYNDRSVLENFHLAQTFHLMFDPTKDCNILCNLSKQDKKELRETMIEMVLATDMASHFAIMGQFKSQLQSDFNPTERASKLLMLRVAMKCSDIGHTTKKPELHRNWTVRVSEEFFLQGDKERENDVPISPFMDRTKEKIHKSQLGFLDFVCKPLFEAWAGFSLEDKELVVGLERNHADWKRE